MKKIITIFMILFSVNTYAKVFTPYDYKDVQPRRVLDYTTTAKANGNNVDAETEANNILQIQMQYRMLTQLTSFEFDQITTAMKK